MPTERTFQRFGSTPDGEWDLTRVLDEHSEHIEKLELVLESLLPIVTRLMEMVGPYEVVGEREEADADAD